MLLIGFLFKFWLLINYKRDVVQEQPRPAVITSFSIDNIMFSIDDDKITGHHDVDIDRTKLVAVFKASGEVTVNSVVQISGVTVNDFSKPLVYTVTTIEGITRQYIVKLTTFTDLPILYIQTDSSITSKEVFVNARFKFDPNSADSGFAFCCKGKIRGRGNSTWEFLKKPYKIKLAKAHSFLGMHPHKEWILLANYADKTLMRNYLSMDLSRRLGMAFTPSCHFVEVFLNGVPYGNYLLIEPVAINSFRLDIDQLRNTDTDSLSITGGYLLEIDQRIKETNDHPYFETLKFPIAIKYPKRASEQQQKYIKEYVLEAERVLYGENFKDTVNGFRKYFDEESVIKWFIVSEIYKNVDSQSFGSIYFYKSRNGKLFMGPLWDFDLGAGNANHEPDAMGATVFFVRYHTWFYRMYEDPDFQEKVKNIWKQYRKDIYSQLVVLDSLLPYLDRSQTLNFGLWSDFSDPAWCVAPNLPSFSHHVNYLRTFLKNRIDWLDEQFR